MGDFAIGIIGLSVMGSNLALNMADHGFQVAGYNRSRVVTEEFVAKYPHKNLMAFYDLPAFLAALQRPRKVMLMIKAGEAVDQMIEQLLPLLDEGDILLDGGNSFFADTRRRSAYLEGKKIHYFGVGVSGGEKGARQGPAIMPGGKETVYATVQPIFEAIAAVAEGSPCCTYIGADGAGHYVKMVHNGIEYADMQLISEAYLLLKHIGGMDNEALAKTFREWNAGELQSYLIAITADIFKEKEADGGYLVDQILDSAGQKGTGRWASIEALQQGVDLSLITAACNVRVLSNLLDERAKAARLLEEPVCRPGGGDITAFVESVRQSLYAAKIVAYAQGFALLRSAAAEFNWDLDLGRIAAIFRGGCIIQARFLNDITRAYARDAQLANLMLDPFFLAKINASQGSLRKIICRAVPCGLPVPAFSNALQYIDMYRSKQIGANLIQAQRDYFGAHTYRRVDRSGDFHHIWQAQDETLPLSSE